MSTAPSPFLSPVSRSAAHHPMSSVVTLACRSVPGSTPGSLLQRATSALKSSSRRKPSPSASNAANIPLSLRS